MAPSSDFPYKDQDLARSGFQTPRSTYSFEEATLGLKGPTLGVKPVGDKDNGFSEEEYAQLLEKAGIIISEPGNVGIDPFSGSDLSGAPSHDATPTALSELLDGTVGQMLTITPEGKPGSGMALLGPAGAAAAFSGSKGKTSGLIEAARRGLDNLFGSGGDDTGGRSFPGEQDAPHSSSNQYGYEPADGGRGSSRSSLDDEITQALMGSDRGGRAAPPPGNPAPLGSVQVSQIGPVLGANAQTLAELSIESLDPGALGIGSYGGEANASNAANDADDVAAYGVDPTGGINPSFLAEGGEVGKDGKQLESTEGIEKFILDVLVDTENPDNPKTLEEAIRNAFKNLSIAAKAGAESVGTATKGGMQSVGTAVDNSLEALRAGAKNAIPKFAEGGVIPAPEMVAQPGAAPPGVSADDVPRQQEEGDFVLNSKAVELAGLPDISKMIQKAIGDANAKGIEVLPQAEPESDPVDILVSNGELIIPKDLVPFIGEEKLVKINNRGKEAMAQEEQAQAQQGPQGLPPQAPGGIPQPQVPGLAQGGQVPVPGMKPTPATSDFLARIEQSLNSEELQNKQKQLTEAIGPKGEVDPNESKQISQGAAAELLSRSSGIFGSGNPGNQSPTGVPLGKEPSSFEKVVNKGRDILGGMFSRGSGRPDNQIERAPQMANLWDTIYHDNKQDPDKAKNAQRRLVRFNEQGVYAPNEEALSSMDKAAMIFDGDQGFTKDQILDTLTAIGVIETGFETKVQTSGGPAKSYWQVEPKTAKSLLKDSGALFGPKFEEIFGEKYGQQGLSAKDTLSQLDVDQLSDLIEDDSDLAASFAMAKWISSTISRTMSGEIK